MDNEPQFIGEEEEASYDYSHVFDNSDNEEEEVPATPPVSPEIRNTVPRDDKSELQQMFMAFMESQKQTKESIEPIKPIQQTQKMPRGLTKFEQYIWKRRRDEKPEHKDMTKTEHTRRQKIGQKAAAAKKEKKLKAPIESIKEPEPLKEIITKPKGRFNLSERFNF